MKLLGALTAASIAVLIVLGVLHYTLLFTGQCPHPEEYRISTFKGRVVGKSLWLVQYRWLRRLFTPVDTTLNLQTRHYEDRPGVGRIPTGREIGTRLVGTAGTFDFGALPPDTYSLTVKVLGEDAVGFGFVIDPLARNSDVLIDASPAHYCFCCGWDFEPHS